MLKLVGTPGTFKLLVIIKLFLGVVLFLTGEVIYAWSSGQLRQEKELALANFKNQLMEASTNDSTDPWEQKTKPQKMYLCYITIFALCGGIIDFPNPAVAHTQKK